MRGQVQTSGNTTVGDVVGPPTKEKPQIGVRSGAIEAWVHEGEATYADCYPARAHENSSPLSATLLGPMIRPWGPCTSGESKPESPLLMLSHQISQQLFLHKNEKDFSPPREKSARTSSSTLPNQPTENHTQDLRLFRCEISKVA